MTTTTARSEAGERVGVNGSTPLLIPCHVKQRGRVVGSGVGPDLAGFQAEQEQWLLREYIEGQLTDQDYHTENLCRTSRSLLTRMATRARKATRPLPRLEGPIFPSSDWRLFTGGDRLPPCLWVKAGRNRGAWIIIYLDSCSIEERRPITLTKGEGT